MLITPEKYEAAIPECCEFSTYDEHQNMMLCWRLVSAIAGGHKMNCGKCELNKMNNAELAGGSDPLKSAKKTIEIAANAAKFKTIVLPLNTKNDIEQFCLTMEQAHKETLWVDWTSSLIPANNAR